MKKYLLACIILIFTYGLISAQDFIKLKDGRTIEARVLNIEEDGVVYKVYKQQHKEAIKIPIDRISLVQFQDGTIEQALFQPQKEIINLDETRNEEDLQEMLYIQYGHHIYENSGKELSVSGIETLFSECPIALHIWEGSQAQQQSIFTKKIMSPILIANAVPIVIAGLILLTVTNGYGGVSTTGTLLVAGGGIVLIAGIATVVGITKSRERQNMYARDAVKSYNDFIRTKNNVSLNVGVTQSGNFGFILRF